MGESGCKVLAEVGINHNCDWNMATEMVFAAAEAGCWGIKFQNWRTEDFITDRSMTITFKSQGREETDSFYELCKRNEMPRDWIPSLKNQCDALGIEFISTPTSDQGIEDLRRVGCRYVKNGSDFITHLPLLHSIASSGMRPIISTGMATEDDVDAAMDALESAQDVILLHCTSCYPTNPTDVNLRRMLTLRDRYGVDVGFSDHTVGPLAAVQAATLGAVLIEKHFTLDHDLPGPDHWFSSTPKEMGEIVEQIQLAEKLLGDARLQPAHGEMGIRDDLRIGVVAAHDLNASSLLRADDVAFRKPAKGILPRDVDAYLGRPLKRDVAKDSPIMPDFFSDD